MRLKRTVFAAGLVVYMASFCLIAVDAFTGAMPGYMCAWLALWVPLAGAQRGDMSTQIFPVWTLGGPAMFASGLTNIAFSIAVFLRGAKPFSAWRQRLQIVIPFMIACGWYDFVLLRAVPREGHVLWVIGLVLALYDEEIARCFGSSSETERVPAESSSRRHWFRLYE